jgi:hypothetical protein
VEEVEAPLPLPVVPPLLRLPPRRRRRRRKKRRSVDFIFTSIHL